MSEKYSLRKIAYKLEKYRTRYSHLVKGGEKIRIGPYTETCSSNSYGSKLNKEGLDKYLDYKKGSCDKLEWKVNSLSVDR